MCQFWIDSSWFDLSSLQRHDGGFYRAFSKIDPLNAVDFNFCRKLKNSVSSPCQGNILAGLWTESAEGEAECDEPLSGEIMSESIQVEGITDRDLNIIGLSMSYLGSPSKDYLLIHIYCDHEQEGL